jgi:hypothetical protein
MKTIKILQSEYDQLRRDQDWLSALEAAGVDNWSGYHEAREFVSPEFRTAEYGFDEDYDEDYDDDGEESSDN